MSSGLPAAGGQEVPAMPCRLCGSDVPAGSFCGSCGAQLSRGHGDGRGSLRIRAYGAAPGEHVLRISVVSTLFPHLPQRSRAPFRVGLAVLLVALVIFAVLRFQAPLIAISALGVPLLFLIYLYEADVLDDLPVRALLLTSVPGFGLGVGWALLTGTVVARTTDVAMGDGMAERAELVQALVIPACGAVLMLVPALVVRVLHPPTRESLDGFVIGSLSAISFTAAATLTLLAPQFTTGLMAHDRPFSTLLVEAGIRGVTVPLTAAACGGLVGAALWFTRPASSTHRHRWLSLALPLGIGVVLAAYAGLALIHRASLPQEVQLGLHLVVMVLALLALRIGLQAALLHEAHDEMNPSEPLLCAHCGHVVPDMAFCPACGVATRASSRSSRAERRLVRPVRTDTTPEEP
jgi:RsiW-degrading membrane proteinase PrsW (M82 family)